MHVFCYHSNNVGKTGQRSAANDEGKGVSREGGPHHPAGGPQGFTQVGNLYIVPRQGFPLLRPNIQSGGEHPGELPAPAPALRVHVAHLPPEHQRGQREDLPEHHQRRLERVERGHGAHVDRVRAPVADQRAEPGLSAEPRRRVDLQTPGHEGREVDDQLLLHAERREVSSVRWHEAARVYIDFHSDGGRERGGTVHKLPVREIRVGHRAAAGRQRRGRGGAGKRADVCGVEAAQAEGRASEHPRGVQDRYGGPVSVAGRGPEELHAVRRQLLRQGVLHGDGAAVPDAAAHAREGAARAVCERDQRPGRGWAGQRPGPGPGAEERGARGGGGGADERDRAAGRGRHRHGDVPPDGLRLSLV